MIANPTDIGMSMNVNVNVKKKISLEIALPRNARGKRMANESSTTPTAYRNHLIWSRSMSRERRNRTTTAAHAITRSVNPKGTPSVCVRRTSSGARAATANGLGALVPTLVPVWRTGRPKATPKD